MKIRLRLRNLYQTSTLGFMGGLISGLLCSLFWSIGPLFARLSNFSGFGIALFMSTTILGGIVLQGPVGYWSDRADRRRIIMLVSYTIVITSMVAIIVPTAFYYLLAVCMFFLGGAMFSIYPLSVAHTNDHPEVMDRISISSNLLLVYGLGAAVGPAIGGMLMHLFGRYSLFGLYIVSGGFLGYYAWHRHQHGKKIPDEDKTQFIPLVRTSQAAIALQPAQEEVAITK